MLLLDTFLCYTFTVLSSVTAMKVFTEISRNVFPSSHYICNAFMFFLKTFSRNFEGGIKTI